MYLRGLFGPCVSTIAGISLRIATSAFNTLKVLLRELLTGFFFYSRTNSFLSLSEITLSTSLRDVIPRSAFVTPS